MEEGSACCPKGSWPALSTDYKPKFSDQKIGDLTCYVAGEKHHKALNLIHDIFGYHAGRTQFSSPLPLLLLILL